MGADLVSSNDSDLWLTGGPDTVGPTTVGPSHSRFGHRRFGPEEVRTQ